MITPNPQFLPGQTPITDPLQLQFMTGGQMGYMPQAQFMTPSELGAFRTMPVPDVNGYVPQNDGFINKFLIAHQGGIPGILPAYTFNTYNPAISPTLQQVYAQRSMHDAAMAVPGMLANAGIGAALPYMFGLPGIAASFLMPDITAPITDRIVEGRKIQTMTTAKIFGGRDVDTGLGQGFKYKAARDLDRMIRYSAADDTILKEGDYRDLLQLGIQYGQFDYAQNVDQYKRILKNMRSSITTMMEVFGSTDFRDIMSNMKRMQDMGATAQQYTNIARSEQVYSRMTGLSHQQMVDTYGQPGALTYQQAGLNAMQGSLQSMSNAAHITFLQRTGVLNPVTLAKFGGVSGMTQRMTQQDAQAHNSIIDLILPGLLNQDMTGFRKDIDIPKLLQDPYSLQNLMHQGGRLYSGEQMMNYQANRHELYTKLMEEQGADNIEMMIAGAAGRMSGFTGAEAFRAGLRMIGMGPEEADYKIRAYFSEGAQDARRRTMEEARRKRREEFLQKNNIFNQFGRWWRGLKTDIGEGVYRVSEAVFGNEEEKAANAAQRVLDTPRGQTAMDIAESRAQAAASTYTVSTPTHYGDTPDEVLKLFRQQTGYTDAQADTLFSHVSHGILSETGTTNLGEAMKKASAVGFGALQLIPDQFDDFFKGAGSKYASTFNKYINEGDQALLVSLRKKRESKKYREEHGGPTQAELDAEKRAQAGWGAIVDMEGFRGAYMSHLMPHVMKDRLGAMAKTDERVAAIMESPFLLTTVFPMGNHFGTDSFKEVMKRGLGNLTAEDIRADLRNTGGYNVALSLYGAADWKFKSLYGQNQRRYEVGGRDFAQLDAERRWFYGMQGGDNGFRGIAERMSVDPDFAVYSQEAKSSNMRGRTIRPDCSGFMREYINELVSSRGGFVMNSEKAAQEILGQEILTSDQLMEAVGKYGTGLQKYTLNNNDAINKFKQNVREGMLIGLDSDNKGDSSHRNGIDHVGTLVWRNNEWQILEQIKGGRQYRSLDSWISSYKGKNFFLADLNAIMRPKTGALPYSVQESQAKLDAIQKQSELEARNDFFDFMDTAVDSKTNIKYKHLVNLDTAMRNAQDSTYDPMATINRALEEKFGTGTKIDASFLQTALGEKTGEFDDATDLIGVNISGAKAFNDVLGKVIARYKGIDYETARKQAVEFRKDPTVQRALTTALVRRYKDELEDPIANVYQLVGPRAEKLNAAVRKQMDLLDAEGYRNIFGVSDPSLITKVFNSEFGDLGDVYREAVFDSEKVKVGNSEFTQGSYFHKLPVVTQMMTDYQQLQYMRGKDDKYGKYADELKGMLHTWAKAAGFTTEELDEELSKTNDVATVIKNLFAKKGIKIDDGSAQDKLLRGSISVAKDVAKNPYHFAYYNPTLEKYKKYDLSQLRSDELTKHSTREYYHDIYRTLSYGTTDFNEMKNLVNKAVVSDSRFEEIMSGLRSAGYDDLVKYITGQREKGLGLSTKTLHGFSTTKRYAEDMDMERGQFNKEQRARQQALGTGAPAPAAGVSPGSGGRGGFLSEATDRALGQLPGVLEKLNKTLIAMNPKVAEKLRNEGSLGSDARRE